MTSQPDLRGSRYVVIVGIDFGEASRAALQEAVALTERAEAAELHLVHVIAIPSSPIAVATAVAPELAYLEQIQSAGKTLQQWLTPFRQAHTRLVAHIRIGQPDRQIAQLATDLSADLVVVGTQSKQGIDRLLLGSVAESLVRRAPCAVLAYRPRAVPAWELIEPPCVDCVRVRRETNRGQFWCQRHSQHHARAHTYQEYPESFAMGSQTFRS